MLNTYIRLCFHHAEEVHLLSAHGVSNIHAGFGINAGDVIQLLGIHVIWCISLGGRDENNLLPVNTVFLRNMQNGEGFIYVDCE